MLYEYRVYEAPDRSKLPLLQRVIEASLPAFERAGMRVAGCWTTEGCISENSNRVIYMLEFRDLAHLQSAWEAYFKDPEVKASFMALTAGDFGFLKSVSNHTMRSIGFTPAAR